jgi:hypothetical protein
MQQVQDLLFSMKLIRLSQEGPSVCTVALSGPALHRKCLTAVVRVSPNQLLCCHMSCWGISHVMPMC